jgi:CHAT domain-containing protein
VQRIGQLFPEAESYLDGLATIQTLRDGTAATDVLHLATHGRFRPDNPMFSALRLADGWLTVRDARDLDLRGCGLVVLSACETGVSQVAAGDELLGMTRGFFAAGAASLVVSLWPVDDTTTVDLMHAFYRALRHGSGTGAALRSAQRQQLAEHPHPFYWAAFALHGRW